MERRYDIDWLRVIAIGLLLIYHIAIVFQPWAMFLAFIRSETLSTNLWKPMTLLNVWRIPILFYVSGMGLFFAMRKRNWSELIKERAKRILVPFLFGIVAVTPLHMFVFQRYYNMTLNYYPHMGHLWFLGNIFTYVILLLPVFLYLKKAKNIRVKLFLQKLMAYPLTPLLVTVFFIVEVIAFKPTNFALYAETWHGFSLGFLCFFFGFLFMYIGPSFWQNVLKWRWLYLGIAAILFTIRFILYATEAPDYLTVMESNSWILAIFGFCHKYLNKPSQLLSYLSTAAYPVYIIHMLVLYAASALILPLKFPVYMSFPLLMVITFIGCFIIYEFVIRRINLLHPLFGLKWNFKYLKRKKKQPLATKTVDE
ncbi:acyltransferase family protein [Jejuia pallidilutea]|uniref:Glucans biosynthesis protein C n=1 Tax=Jejuia pallidilutea TaxID=504487 RepID=A0A090WAD8_9FLAO|nr:acyltransferase family protein [Jejuia pallidilutea]GAL72419.1 glucans biosynthesis protein C [Jejuia pallidilutea]GAL88644.1 glucans biosynthesis protein C [Jejuia pallidilutea]